MMEVVLLVVFPGVLIALLLFLVSGTKDDEARSFQPAFALDERLATHRESAQCPPAVVRRLFAPDDWNFVTREGSRDLNHLYSAERKRVAAHWVRNTSLEISQVMRQHLQQAGRSANLKVADELKLFSQFAMLRVMCGLLLVVLRFAQPHLLTGLAAYTSEFSRSFCAARASIAMGAGSGRSMGNVGAA